MTEALLISIAVGFAIGVTLGCLGGGGSILTVPALIYLIGQTPQLAVTTSLAVVGVNSALGVYLHRAHGTLNPRVALLFGGAGMIASYTAAGLSKHLPPTLLLVAFAALMLVVSLIMLRRRIPEQAEEPELSLIKIVGTGAGVGLLTGILGVGGGFLIVPALVMLLGLPMHQAVGTSLLVITMNSAAGFLGHLDGIHLDMSVIAAFIAAGMIGTFAGTRLNRYLPAQRLRQGFAVFVLLLGIFLLFDNLPKLLA
ncbi:MAG: sulfite exporter TauE/SafE family protein [Anaerolineae bacterium]|nr:sulfite exporter TauE/SafE family protein [Anaerolineae bacterium]